MKKKFFILNLNSIFKYCIAQNLILYLKIINYKIIKFCKYKVFNGVMIIINVRYSKEYLHCLYCNVCNITHESKYVALHT